MAIQVALHHLTHYKFDRPVSLSPHIIRLRPAPHSRTPIESYSLNISPGNHFINWQQDPFGNYLARIVFPEKADHLKIEVEVLANLYVINPFDFFLQDDAEHYPFEYDEVLKKELTPYLELEDEMGPLFEELLAKIDTEKQRTIDFLIQVNQLVNRTLDYDIRMDPGVRSPESTLGKGIGSCRDFSWLLVQLLRKFGLAARFVSGYSVQLVADEKPLDGPAGVPEDVTDLHAWVEVYVPGAGWIGLDSTSGLFCTEGHIPLACVPNPKSAAPIEGYTDECEVEFEFSNTVARLHEDPRVTKPYTESQWESINALGQQVDQDLWNGDVRLTMGGEPTFVSIDDMEAKEWNTGADGQHKRQLAWDLANRVRDSFGPGGVLHYAQGKWYPGEPLPRWSYNLIWRKDGYRIWNNPDLQAHPSKDYGFQAKDAKRFIQYLSRQLGLSEHFVVPAYEDVYYMLWEESRLPEGKDPFEVDLEDPLERRALAQSLEQGLSQEVGYALPLGWDYGRQGWYSCPWNFRRGRMYLMPGNSPMGLRLPLEGLPANDQPQTERSLFEDLPPINAGNGVLEPDPNTVYQVIRTAMCVEARQGKIYIFFPPTSWSEHYLTLIRHIETTAAALQMPVIIEGYLPPRDYRMENINISPDPGVIEVNIHPTSSWSELVENTTTLYEQARQSRLGTEKFMIDGRHTGTGGGNHITIGAARPVDSPFLRRPDLLRSIIAYWQNHPSLSYVFSSAFVGPTSQAPRVDETFPDRLYELEIAFRQVPEPNSGYTPYWLVDRIFRNLLTDITGNTHRSELCIDKMYSPDSANGRLGLLEMRGFDMPPHKHMSLVQMLLVRALVSKFWNEPYEKPLVRWGTSLYDKYLLPHFCYQDMLDVTEDLQAFGYDFRIEWLDPFFEFRFPRYGTTQARDITMEVRMAIEPWHVLGEEMSNMGTARFVDSSLERIQVKVNGLTDSRYILVCNNCRIPLQATGVHGEYVAGVRYRAWQPPSALHPTIGIDSPLVFDLIDTWNNRVIGGCTYHVSHPGGLAYETFPVNSYEAESRRYNRFTETDHTPGTPQYTPINYRTISFHRDDKLRQYTTTRVKNKDSKPTIHLPEPIVNPEFPFTLDLRLARK